MSEVWVRVLVVAAALVLVWIVAAMARLPARSGTAFDGAGLAPGVYLFTSRACLDCQVVRDRLVERLGTEAFTEIEWEEDPDLFALTGIEAVPCTVVVTGDGEAIRHPGMPDAVLDRLNP
jgi:hypothetical protein